MTGSSASLPGPEHTAWNLSFHTAFTRTSYRLSFDDGGWVMLDIDVGEIVTATASEPLCELELELEAGPAYRLFELARRINADVPLRVSVSSKANRGYALAAGETEGWNKFARPDLTGNVTVEDAIALAVQGCLDHLLGNETCLLETDDPEGVHQVRIALRRLRSTLRLFRSVLPADQYRWLTDEIKWLTKQLAAARDWDVFSDEIVAPVAAHFSAEPGFALLRSGLGQKRRTSRRTARRAVRSKRYTEFVLRVSGWLAQRQWRGQEHNEASARLSGPVNDFVDTLIAGRHRQVRKDGHKFATMTDEQRHQFRIDVKKLRYATDLFGSLYRGKRATRYLERLGELQDALGYANDVAVAEDLTRNLCETTKGDDGAECQRAGAIVLGWHAHTMARASGPLAKYVKRFIATRPPHTKR
jgi:triphosphatase